MTGDRPSVVPVLQARIAGVLYLVIIVFGLCGELFIRSRLIVPGDARATAANLMASPGVFRLGFLTDSIMILSDVGLAVLLCFLLVPVNKMGALSAMCFRLAQSAVLALNLLHYHAAGLLLNGSYPSILGAAQADSLAYFFLDLHAHGYDLALLLFGCHCLLLGYLLFRSQYFPRLLGVLAAAAGIVYLVGTYTRFLAPAHVDTLAPIYIVAIVSEISLCLWLLVKGVRPEHWKAVAGVSPSS